MYISLCPFVRITSDPNGEILLVANNSICKFIIRNCYYLGIPVQFNLSFFCNTVGSHKLINCNRSFQHTKVISTGISDFHKMVVTVMKATFPKSKPREIFYRSYKKFDKEKFREDLKHELYVEIENNTKYQSFERTFLYVLERHAPLKRKLLRANEVPYMTKALRKAIATRSRLENRFHRLKTSDSKKAFKKQRNYCSRLYKKERKRFYDKLDSKCITDNKLFWKTVKPFFTDKGLSKRTITLIKGDKIISEDVDVANALNAFFESAVKNLGITEPTD